MISLISSLILPVSMAAIVLFGLYRRRPVYDDFIDGAREGLSIVADILPTIIGLIVSVNVLRASGLLDFLSEWLTPLAERIHFPSELIPLTLVRIFSTSAANGFLFDIFAGSGPDSPEGFLASLMMSSTEAVFYTISIYFTAAGITRTRWTLPGCLAATFGGIAASTLITTWLF